MLLDIHSHILPGIDDGAKNIEESLIILEMMKKQGITDVIATPHFYANSDNLEDYTNRVNNAFSLLSLATRGKNLPNIMLGSEVLYYRYIGNSESIYNFCLNGSRYLLLELTDDCIGNELFSDIIALRDNMGVSPIIAHLERYYKSSSYKKLLKFISEENILIQVNASSLFSNVYYKPAKNLIKKGFVSFIASDAHSPKERPPMLKNALQFISENFGSEYLGGFMLNSQILFDKITGDSNAK